LGEGLGGLYALMGAANFF